MYSIAGPLTHAHHICMSDHNNINPYHYLPVTNIHHEINYTIIATLIKFYRTKLKVLDSTLNSRLRVQSLHLIRATKLMDNTCRLLNMRSLLIDHYAGVHTKAPYPAQDIWDFLSALCLLPGRTWGTAISCATPVCFYAIPKELGHIHKLVFLDFCLQFHWCR